MCRCAAVSCNCTRYAVQAASAAWQRQVGKDLCELIPKHGLLTPKGQESNQSETAFPPAKGDQGPGTQFDVLCRLPSLYASEREQSSRKPLSTKLWAMLGRLVECGIHIWLQRLLLSLRYTIRLHK